MLNFDAYDRQLQLAASDTVSFEDFEKTLNRWEEFHGADNYGAFFNTFCSNSAVLLSLLPHPQVAATYALHQNVKIEQLKKLKLILDSFQKRNLYLEPLSVNNGEKFYQRLTNNRFLELLEHPLVKDEMAIDIIRQYLLEGKTDKAIQKFKETKLDPHRVFSQPFVAALVAAIPQAPKVDKMLSDLAKQDLLPLSVISSLSPVPFNVATLANYPKLTQTDLVAIMSAIAALSKEAYADGNPSLVALRLIDQYVSGNKKLATELLRFLQDQRGAHTLSAEQATDIEKITLALFDNGAEISPGPGMSFDVHPLYQLMIRNGMLKALAHPASIQKFKSSHSYFQSSVLALAGKYDQAVVAPSQTDLEMMKILCPHVSKDNCGQSYFDVQRIINVLNAWLKYSHDLESHQRFLESLGLLLEHGLVDGIDSVQPYSHRLDQPVACRYDLHTYIMDNPALRRGFRIMQRDEELLSLYGLTKAILAQETRTATELQKVKHYAGFSETTEAGVPVVYNRYDLKEQMQNTQKNVRAAIMKWVDPARDIPADRRQVTANNLERIALEHLPAVEQAQNTNQDATAQTSKDRRKLQ